MREPSFWWRDRSMAATLLGPLGAAYGAVAAQRLRQEGREAGVPVICIGNFTLGGAGKTPTAIAVARMLRDAGEQPVFLSRGYGGELSGPVRVDPLRHRAADVGDEPLLLAQAGTAIVARDRVAGAQAARAAGGSIVVMDDGLQNPSLVKHAALAVVDGRRGVGNGQIFPAGPLRAPLDAQLDRVHAVLVMGEPFGATRLLAAARARGIRIFRARLEPDAAAIEALRGSRVLAFAGIGDPAKFFATVDDAGLDAPVRQAFADHHRYTPGEIEAIIASAHAEGLIPLTTEKDFVRLRTDPAGKALAARVRTLPVTVRIDDEPAFRQWLLDAVRA